MGILVRILGRFTTGILARILVTITMGILARILARIITGNFGKNYYGYLGKNHGKNCFGYLGKNLGKIHGHVGKNLGNFTIVSWEESWKELSRESWEDLLQANINTYFSIGAKCWLNGGVGGQNDDNDPKITMTLSYWF